MPGPVYQITTPRLVIRCCNPSDAPLVWTAVNESREHLKPYMEWAHHEASLDETVELLRNWRGHFDSGQDFPFVIFDLSEKHLIGCTGLHKVEQNVREIGYWIHKDFVKQGFATEVSAALTKVGFEIEKMERIEIHCAISNKASAAVPRKLGYTHEATRRRIGFANGHAEDSMIWTMFGDEYPNSPCAQAQLEAFDAAGRKIQ
jgi:RimJ/RimL family protein N-acetyltransferase